MLQTLGGHGARHIVRITALEEPHADMAGLRKGTDDGWGAESLRNQSTGVVSPCSTAKRVAAAREETPSLV